jgi:pyruvate kinase
MLPVQPGPKQLVSPSSWNDFLLSCSNSRLADVANLCLDGADGILFGGETFRGVGPVITLQTVGSICAEAEKCFDSAAFYRSYMDQVHDGGYSDNTNFDKAEALASASVRAAEKAGAKLIIVFTVTGRTAALMAKFKPKAPILAVICPVPSTAEFSTTSGKGMGKGFHRMSQANLLSYASDDGSGSMKDQGTPASNHVMRQCLALRGVVPIMADASIVDSSGLLSWAVSGAKEKALLKTGEKVIVSLCPRKEFDPIIEEVGIMSLIEA